MLACPRWEGKKPKIKTQNPEALNRKPREVEVRGLGLTFGFRTYPKAPNSPLASLINEPLEAPERQGLARDLWGFGASWHGG